jgi:hypothetical protein
MTNEDINAALSAVGPWKLLHDRREATRRSRQRGYVAIREAGASLESISASDPSSLIKKASVREAEIQRRAA